MVKTFGKRAHLLTALNQCVLDDGLTQSLISGQTAAVTEEMPRPIMKKPVDPTVIEQCNSDAQLTLATLPRALRRDKKLLWENSLPTGLVIRRTHLQQCILMKP